MKTTIAVLIVQLLYFSILFSQSEAAFNSIKIGMKDTQVEKILGLPVEIFRGFSEIEDGEVVRHGQLNYITWRYGQLVRIVDTVMDFVLSDTLIHNADTLGFRFNDSIYVKSPQLNLVDDTIYRIGKVIFSKEQYYMNKPYGTPNYYEAIPVIKKKPFIDSSFTYLSQDTIFTPKLRTITFHKCVLFEPSSNRVSTVGYYPFKVDIKSKPIKKLKRIK